MLFKDILEGGKCIFYGVCVVIKGGLYFLFKMIFLGGFLIGCDVGILNFSKIKGMYMVMKSGMIVVEILVEVLK